MKIAMIGHKDYPSRSGGVEVVVNELSTRLSHMGHQVEVYNRGYDGRPHKSVDSDGVISYRVPTPRNSQLNAIVYSFLATLKALPRKYSLIHFHCSGPASMIIFPRLFRIPTVVTIHGLDWNRAKWGGFASKYLLFGEKTAARYADEIIVLNSDTQKYILDKYHRQTTLLENGITPIKQLPADEITSRFGLTKGSYILFLARIVPEKGLHHLIKAYKKLRPDYKLVIAGSLDNTDYVDSIRKMAEGEKDIIFTGFVQGALIQELYANCALYVLPSDLEGMALTLLEALSCGAKCLVSDIPENTVLTGDFAWTFRPGDADSLTGALAKALAAPDDPHARAEQIRITVRNHDWDSIARRTVEIYENAIGRHKKS